MHSNKEIYDLFEEIGDCISSTVDENGKVTFTETGNIEIKASLKDNPDIFDTDAVGGKNRGNGCDRSGFIN